MTVRFGVVGSDRIACGDHKRALLYGKIADRLVDAVMVRHVLALLVQNAPGGLIFGAAHVNEGLVKGGLQRVSLGQRAATQLVFLVEKRECVIDVRGIGDGQRDLAPVKCDVGAHGADLVSRGHVAAVCGNNAHGVLIGRYGRRGVQNVCIRNAVTQHAIPEGKLCAHRGQLAVANVCVADLHVNRAGQNGKGRFLAVARLARDAEAYAAHQISTRETRGRLAPRAVGTLVFKMYAAQKCTAVTADGLTVGIGRFAGGFARDTLGGKQRGGGHDHHGQRDQERARIPTQKIKYARKL